MADRRQQVALPPRERHRPPQSPRDTPQNLPASRLNRHRNPRQGSIQTPPFTERLLIGIPVPCRPPAKNDRSPRGSPTKCGFTPRGTQPHVSFCRGSTVHVPALGSLCDLTLTRAVPHMGLCATHKHPRGHKGQEIAVKVAPWWPYKDEGEHKEASRLSTCLTILILVMAAHRPGGGSPRDPPGLLRQGYILCQTQLETPRPVSHHAPKFQPCIKLMGLHMVSAMRNSFLQQK